MGIQTFIRQATAALVGSQLVLGTAVALASNPQAVNRTAATCPDYADYSQKPQGNPSSGPLGLPDMRPSPECRTFNSSAVEKIISDMESRLRDPDVARLFANTMASTLDTTVKYFDPDVNLAFIVTGDITAQWLRDTSGQFAHLYKILPQDDQLRQLVKAIINTESRYVTQYPYCGSFQPPPESGLQPSVNGYSELVLINPPVNNQTVFECKFELDSLSGFLKITRGYWTNTQDSSFINDNWNNAVETILTTLDHNSFSSFDDDYNFISYHNWTGLPGGLSGPVTNGGNGEPNKANGLIKCLFRPSDDRCVLNYITSDNAMMSVELDHLADMLDQLDTGKDLSGRARKHAQTIRQAIWDHTISSNGLFAYETNGFGGQYLMDDANVPSLISLPYLGFLDRNDSTYQKTKAAMYSHDNPYYAEGDSFKGIGGPHVNLTYPWPMSQVSGIYGADDDQEISERLYLIVNNTNGLGLIHESINIYNATDYTRPWFAWANSYFAEMVLDLAERKPHLIFNDDTPYVVGQ